jgi:hypothetical protein
MKANRLPSLLAVVVLLASGLYFFVYLWRWEWNRAVVAGVLFLAAEVGLATVVVLNRLRGLGEQARPETLSRIRETAPPPRDHFAWLRPRGELGVFVPVLMGVGAVASVLAWVVERLARATAGPALERGLAGRLTAISWPVAGLQAGARAGADPLSLLRGPVPRDR